MWVYHPESLDIKQANDVARRLYGYSQDEFLGMNILDLHPAEKRTAVADHIMGREKKYNKSGVWEHITKAGDLLFVRVFSQPIQVKGESYKLAVAIEITEQKQIEQHLRVEKELLNIVIEKLPGTFFVLNKDGNMLRWNKQLERITGYSQDEVKEKAVLSYFGVDEQPKIQEAIATAFETGRVEVESKVNKKEGGQVPILFNVTRTFYNDEECIVGIGLDISNHQRMIREKEILLSEIHHRVKNNLALINSILYLQASEITDELFQRLLHDTRLRIKIIALAHELLYKGDHFTKINYGDFIKLIVELLQQVSENEQNQLFISVDADSIELNINQALPLSLLINEIITRVQKDIAQGTSSKKMKINIFELESSFKLNFSYLGEFQFLKNVTEGDLSDLLIRVLCDQLEAELSFSYGPLSICSIEFKKSMGRGSVTGAISELNVNTIGSLAMQ